MERPELRIVTEDLWQRVQERLQLVKEIYGHAGAGIHNQLERLLVNRSLEVRLVRSQLDHRGRQRPEDEA
jgi:hypothetical protein